MLNTLVASMLLVMMASGLALSCTSETVSKSETGCWTDPELGYCCTVDGGDYLCRKD